MTVEKSFELPDLGEGLADAELMHWHVAVGDVVTLNQVIADVETAKAAVELPSPYAGQVLSLHVAEGETVTVGSPIITFAVEAPAGSESTGPRSTGPRSTGPESAGPSSTGSAPAAATATAGERVPVLVGYGATAGTSSRRNGRPRPAVAKPAAPAAPAPLPATSPAASPVTAPSVAASPVTAAPVTAPSMAASPGTAAAPIAAPAVVTAGRPLAKPLVRKLARDNGLDLTGIAGTGPDGVITRQDVLDHLRTATSTVLAPAVPEQPPTTEREERIPIRGVRKATAQAMVRSAFTAPTVTEFITVDVTATMNLLKQLRAGGYLDGVRLTMLAFVAKALVSAVGRHPSLNSAWDEAAQEIVLKRYVNLGIATATPRGLMVPNLKDAGDLDLIGLARALERLTETAREGRATPAELTGGTISITNVGVFGVDTGTPILNPGEAAILCLGAVREQPWVHEGQLAVRWVTTLSLSFDHRLVDGEQGSRFLADVAATLSKG
jgi:2-oxoisovalerate dehydrogenase E2 component (dihydrolipoyl transacylase)